VSLFREKRIVTAMFSTDGKPVLPKKKQDQSKRRAGYQPKFSVNGRPTKRSSQLEKALLAAVETGAPYRIACSACGISSDTFTEWRRKDPVFARQVEIAAGKTALRLLKKIEANADQNFSAAAWILERRFPNDFSRPEVQLNIQQNNVTQNNGLVINITETEIREIEAAAEPIRGSVAEMFAQYRPALENGNGQVEEQKQVVEAEAQVIEAPIVRQPGDENSAAFWSLFVGDPARLVERSTAAFVVRIIVSETVRGGQCPRVDFDNGIVRVADCLHAIERIVGAGSAAGWQRLQQKAGIKS
jgi:hypothetical protein